MSEQAPYLQVSNVLLRPKPLRSVPSNPLTPHASRLTFHPLRLTFHASRLLLVLVLAGCAVPAVPGTVIYEDPTTFIRVEPDPKVVPDRPETYHGHPVSLGAEQLAQVFRGFRVRDHRIGIHVMMAGQAAWEPVFREEEITLLALKVAEALAQADYHERIVYYLSRPQTAIKREITTGALYVHGNHLHFMLANRDLLYGVPAYGMVYDRRYPTRPAAPKWFDLDFELAGAVVKQESSFLDYVLGRENDEIVIDLGKLGIGGPVVWLGLRNSVLSTQSYPSVLLPLYHT